MGSSPMPPPRLSEREPIMHVKLFREHEVLVKDPIRPNRRVIEKRLIPAGGHEIVDGDNVYVAGEDDWIEVPADLGERLLKVRAGGGDRYFTPYQVDEEIAVGRITLPDPEPEEPKGPTRVAKPAA